MHHETRVYDDMQKIHYCVLTVTGNPTMSGGGGRRRQQPLVLFKLVFQPNNLTCTCIASSLEDSWELSTAG